MNEHGAFGLSICKVDGYDSIGNIFEITFLLYIIMVVTIAKVYY